MIEIWMRLLEEGTDVYRLVPAERQGEYFKIVASSDYDPEDEEWEFPPGSIVRCSHVWRENTEGLLAVELAHI